MIEKKDYITEAQLKRDIAELKKNPVKSSGRSAAMEHIEKSHHARKRLLNQYKAHNAKKKVKRSLSPKAVANGCKNGITRKNSVLKHELDAVKLRMTDKYKKVIGYLR